MQQPLSFFQQFYQHIANTELSPWLQVLPKQLADWQAQQTPGELRKWQKLLAQLPQTYTEYIELSPRVAFGQQHELTPSQHKQIIGTLQQFMPWRKGPFYIHDIHIDTEWRSDWKWQRVAPHLAPLAGKKVLDVGCGSGYHMWCMLEQQPETVVGVDPSLLFLMQFQAIKHFNPDPRIHLLPLGVEHLPALHSFDTVFSMGVLYHRRSPIDFLQQLKQCLRSGGELVLETLIIKGDAQQVLVPEGRYAQMRNVWFLPSAKAMLLWLTRAGFKQARLVDESLTSTDEQRSTPWMQNQSLADFLNPQDPSLTIEGHPAPRRAVFIAKA